MAGADFEPGPRPGNEEQQKPPWRDGHTAPPSRQEGSQGDQGGFYWASLQTGAQLMSSKTLTLRWYCPGNGTKSINRPPCEERKRQLEKAGRGGDTNMLAYNCADCQGAQKNGNSREYFGGFDQAGGGMKKARPPAMERQGRHPIRPRPPKPAIPRTRATDARRGVWFRPVQFHRIPQRATCLAPPAMRPRQSPGRNPPSRATPSPHPRAGPIRKASPVRLRAGFLFWRSPWRTRPNVNITRSARR